MESSILSRKAIPPSQDIGHGRAGALAGTFFLWRKRLLSRWLGGLGTVPCALPHDKENLFRRRLCPSLWLLLGSFAADKARRNSRADAFSSAGTDEKTESGFS